MLGRPLLPRRASRILSWLSRCSDNECVISFAPVQLGSLARSVVVHRQASSSSKRWQTRQGNDKFSKEAKVQGLKSRAAFKLLEINEKYKVFNKGQTVVDLVSCSQRRADAWTDTRRAMLLDHGLKSLPIERRPRGES
jgi:hypothetical protein